MVNILLLGQKLRAQIKARMTILFWLFVFSVQAAETKLTAETRALRQKVESDQATEIEHERKINALQVRISLLL